MASPVEADKVGCSGDYCLWALPHGGYIHVYDTTGELTATRADVGSQSNPAGLAAPRRAARPHRRLQRAGGGPADGGRRRRRCRVRPGRVVTEHADLENGAARAVVHTTRRATVVLSASYDPGWHATVNGRPAPTVMVAPALVGVVVGPGVHTVAFTYDGYGSYTRVFVLAVVVLVALAVGTPGVAPDAAVDGGRRGDNGGP